MMVVLRHHWQPTRNRHGRPKALGGVGLERRPGTHLGLGVLGSRETAAAEPDTPWENRSETGTEPPLTIRL